MSSLILHLETRAQKGRWTCSRSCGKPHQSCWSWGALIPGPLIPLTPFSFQRRYSVNWSLPLWLAYVRGLWFFAPMMVYVIPIISWQVWNSSMHTDVHIQSHTHTCTHTSGHTKSTGILGYLKTSWFTFQQFKGKAFSRDGISRAQIMVLAETSSAKLPQEESIILNIMQWMYLFEIKMVLTFLPEMWEKECEVVLWSH